MACCPRGLESFIFDDDDHKDVVKDESHTFKWMKKEKKKETNNNNTEKKKQTLNKKDKECGTHAGSASIIIKSL